MFCRKCGKSLLDGDRFCSYCGAQVIERPDLTAKSNLSTEIEEVVYNRAQNENSAEETTAVDIGAPEKSIAQTWGDIKERSLDRNTNPHWNLEGFPNLNEEPKKTEDIRVDWEKNELLTFEIPENSSEEPAEESVAEVKPESEGAETGEKAIREEAKENKRKPDIFEIFDMQLKEEKEAEINDKDTIVFKRKSAEPETTESNVPDLEQELFSRRREPLSGSAEEQIDKFYTFSKKNEEFQKLLDKEYERLKIVSGADAKTEKEPVNIQSLQFPKQFPNLVEEKQEEEPPVQEKVSQPEVKEAVPKPVESVEKEEKSETEHSKETENPIQGNDKVEPQEADKEADKAEDNRENEQEEKQQDGGQPEKSRFTASFPWETMERSVGEFSDEEKKTSPVAVILGIVGVLLVVELALLGVKYFLPESNAAKFIDKNLGVAVNWVDMLKGQDEGKDITGEEKKQDEAAQQADADLIDPAPKADKTELISANVAFNANITEISADDSLCFDENTDYGDELINNSMPIENNIWYQDESGNAVFYDNEIVKTLIMFDSSWIDYVNSSNTAVLGLLKEGSPAYENAVNFSKKGKITEGFDSLKIGEIRQNGNVFFVWAKEVISTTEGQKTSSAEHQWIYRMEAADSQIKIVKYTEF
ncbi:MAG: zinc-ribbon domain-containing protein [Anaerovoracaceae bacterium]